MNSLDLTQFVGKLPKAGKTILDSYSPNIVIPIVYLQSLISFTFEVLSKQVIFLTTDIIKSYLLSLGTVK